MMKVHPNATAVDSPAPSMSGGEAAVLTVWRKSLLFNGNGFTVFDARGDLAFRVDNYSASSKGEILLMDVAGAPLLTVRRKKLSLRKQWMVYEGEEAVNPIFSVNKHVTFRHSKSIAHVTSRAGVASFEVEGSYGQRSCVVYGSGRRQVAEIKRKSAAIGSDVFRLTVEPELSAPAAMAILIVLDQMFDSRTKG